MDTLFHQCISCLISTLLKTNEKLFIKSFLQKNICSDEEQRMIAKNDNKINQKKYTYKYLAYHFSSNIYKFL